MTSSSSETEAAPPRQEQTAFAGCRGEVENRLLWVSSGCRTWGTSARCRQYCTTLANSCPVERFYAISYRPEDTSRRHHVASVAVPARYSEPASRAPVPRSGGLARLLRIVFRRIPGELSDWIRAIRTLRGTDLIDHDGNGDADRLRHLASGFPYDVFKWAAAARLAGCKVRFVGIGVGPIYSWLSRVLIRYALSLADYRSFRDQFSKSRIEKNGFDSDGDPVFPDLAFSLPPDIFPQRPNRTRPKRLVGLGIMDFRDIHIANPGGAGGGLLGLPGKDVRFRFLAN